MPRTTWQYEIRRLEVKGVVTARVDLDAARTQLDGLGADGWELVAAVSGSETGSVLCIFKRPA
jgi:hypothetical protein